MTGGTNSWPLSRQGIMFRPSSLLKALLPFLFLGSVFALRAADLAVEVEPRWQNQPLVLSNLSLKNAAGNDLSVTRLALLLSSAKLQREDGTWLGAGNWQAFLDVEKKRTSFTLKGV